MIPPQAEAVAAELQRILGEDLVGVYLHGSAVLGCFGPHSDVDLVVVASRQTTDHERRATVDTLLVVSAPYAPPGLLRPVELDLVVASALNPWQYPTPLDFHFSEEFRSRFEAEGLHAWEGLESRDLAAHITVVRRAGVPLRGPSVEDVFPEVPWADYAHALTHDLHWLRERYNEIPRYAVLSAPRIWATLATGVPHSKASGAEWALPRLEPELRPVLQHGLAHYTGVEPEERWDELPVARYVARVAEEIERVR